MIDLIADFNKTLRKYHMLALGDHVLVAVSGGPDSVALFHLLCAVSKEWELDLSIGHLNHMVRGKDSDADANFVSQLGSDFGVPVFLDRIDVARERSGLKTSFQEAARILRYGFLEDTLRKIGGNKIALGHIGNDQVETILMNFLRGSGASGLSGMPPVRGPYIRPLIHNFRLHITHFLKMKKIPFRTDVSNQDRRYLRNRVRFDLVPKLVEEYNSQIHENLLEMAEIFRDEDDFLEKTIRPKWDLCFLKGKQGINILIDLNLFLQQHPAVRKRVIRNAIRFVKGDLRRVTVDHVRLVDNLAVKASPGKTVHLPGSIEVRRDQQELIFGRNLRDKTKFLAKEIVAAVPLQIPGTTVFPKSRVKFETQLLEATVHTWENVSCEEAFLDFDLTGEDLYWRFLKAGDRFIPLGMNGTKKLKSFFIDAKVPWKERSQIPLLTSSKGDIIWIYGHRISNFYKVTATTRKILYVKGNIKESDIVV